MKIFMFFIFFLFLGAFFIVSNNNLGLDSSENVGHFFKLYGAWIDELFDNTKIATGYIIKMEWLPQEEK